MVRWGLFRTRAHGRARCFGASGGGPARLQRGRMAVGTSSRSLTERCSGTPGLFFGHSWLPVERADVCVAFEATRWRRYRYVHGLLWSIASVSISMATPWWSLAPAGRSSTW